MAASSSTDHAAAAVPNTTSHTTNTNANLLSTHRALVDTVASFLTVATHHILFLRRLYPPVSFLSTRAYNYPVRQNRHPAVCAWVNDAVAAVRDQLEKNTVNKVSLCIYECDRNQVLERWTFDLSSFPAVSKRDRDVPITSDESGNLTRKINVADLEANFRASISRIATSAARLRPLPEGAGAPECSFTLAMEVRDDADRPVGRLDREDRKWMAAEPEPPPENSGSSTPQLHAIRRLEAGELRMEIWVEESAAKFEYNVPPDSGSHSTAAADRRTKMSYGAGTDRFDPDNGYDLEPADLNRKPQGGAMTDYK
jgi:mitotic spindle assembly checkpoint protein MAD2B